MVLMRMPWRSRLRCRAVCRRWRDILSGPAAWRDVPRERPHYALMVVCRHGAIDVAARLTIQFGLTDDFGAEDYGFFETFCRACEDGNLPVIEWLATTFGLTADDIRTEDNEALSAACSGGEFRSRAVAHCGAVETATDCNHDHVADWLTGRFGLQGAG
jgi:hypothetical protein